MSGEVLLILVLLLAASLPWWSTGGRSRRGLWMVLAALLAGGALGVALVRPHFVDDPAPSIDPRVAREGGWVGSETCVSCHPFRHGTWHFSYHRSMTQVAGPESVLAPFDGTELELEGMIWRPERRGDQFWVNRRPVEAAADSGASVARRVVMTTGSHNYQLYWLEAQDERGMSQFPIVWLVQEQLWIPRKSRFLMPPKDHTPNETGRWKAHCIKCHATHGRKEDLPSRETRVAELGIACEACHGPGQEHVARHGSPLRRYLQHLQGTPDPTIVNPRRLAHDRSTEVCAQCHSIEVFLTDEKAQDWLNHGTRYRPGDVLAEHQTTVIGRYADNPPAVRDYLDRRPAFLLPNCFWPDGVLRVAGREYNALIETPCFQRGQMSCLSCHRMHPAREDQRPLSEWADDQLSPGMRGDQACLQCHQAFQDEAKQIAHTHHDAASAGSRCYNCHMPYTTWGLLRAIRQHTVDSPSVATSVTTGRPNACNQCHLDRTLQWTSQYLEEWYGIEPVELSKDQQGVAASVMWTLRGDAVQRALMAWSMGWEPARQVSGTEWMVPYLSILLKDPYDAVRFNAQRSLGRYPAYAGTTAAAGTASTAAEHGQMFQQILPHWLRTFRPSNESTGTHLLIRPDGTLDQDRINHFAAQRDDRDLYLSE